MQIIDGKKVSAQVKEEVKRQTLELKETHKITPGLAVVIVGDDPASRVYVNNKKKACEFVGFKSEEYALPAETTQEELLNLVETLNNKKDINGILVQLPLPKHLDDKAVIEAISPLKDVDAFHAVNVGKIMLGEYDFLPCTPAGVHGRKSYSPSIILPTFTAWNASTSLSGLIASITALSSRCFGNGS